MAYKKITPAPQSILSALYEPLVDPKDGHGARSSHDVMILQKWGAAKKGDDRALEDLLKLIVRESLAELKAARGDRTVVQFGGGSYKIRTLIPVMTRLGMITSETVGVAPQGDGYVTVTERQKITHSDWFAAYAFERPDAKPKDVEAVLGWLAGGGIQRPHRYEGHR